MSILYDERVDGALPKVDKAALLAELRQRLPDLDILHTQEDLKPYECDGLSAYRTTPMLVVLPERIEQVQQLLTDTVLLLPELISEFATQRQRQRSDVSAAPSAGHD